MTILIGWIVIGVVIVLFLTGSVLSLGACCAPNPSGRTRVLLVLLRLAIGWHFFTEGMDKLYDPAWTGAGYLREATGPLAPRFRELAGDLVDQKLPIIDNKVDVGPSDAERQVYVDAVKKFYHLDNDQAGKLDSALEPVKKESARLLKEQPKLVERTGANTTTYRQEMTVKERIDKYHDFQKEALEIEEGLMRQYGSEGFEAWKTAKTNVGHWRSELLKDLTILDHETKRMIRLTLLQFAEAKLSDKQKKDLLEELRKARRPTDKEFIKFMPVDQQEKLLEAVKKWREKSDQDQDLLEQSDKALLDIFAEKALSVDDREKLSKTITDSRNRLRVVWDKIELIKEKQDENISGVYRAFFYAIEKKENKDPNDQAFLDDSFVKLVRGNVLEKRRKDQSNLDPLPFSVTPPLSRWTLLDFSDLIVMYGVLAVGVMLLAGLLTRLACVGGAGFVLLFFLAMPSLANWPESPKVEGHYMYINKQVIEMLALLALGTTRSGRWLGVDGLLQFLCPRCWRSKQECVKV